MRCALGCAVPLLLLLLAPSAGAQPTAEGEVASAIEEGIVDRDVASALADDSRVRLIVRLAPGTDARGRADRLLTRLPELRVVRRFDRTRGLAVVASVAEVARLARDPDVTRIGLDRRMTVQLSQAVPLVELDVVNSQGFTGLGRLVAILDTGVDLDHPDLQDAIVAEVCFCLGSDGPGGSGCCPNGQDTQTGPGAGDDGHGHGTRVAGVVANQGIVAPHAGGAPEVQILAVRVLDASGSGFASDIAAGMDWVATNWPEADVLNLSLGGGQYSGDCDTADASTELFAAEIDALWDVGILTVAGAGNDGFGEDMIAPACVARAISVGAVWDANVGSQTRFGCTDATTAPDQVACWSNSSATTDVFAPGGRTTSSTRGGGTSTFQGTSYAAPIVSACLAALRGANPSATTTALSHAATTSPTKVTDTTSGRSFPRLDCSAALAVILAPVPALPDGGGVLVLLFLALGAAAIHRGGGVAQRPGDGLLCPEAAVDFMPGTATANAVCRRNVDGGRRSSLGTLRGTVNRAKEPA